LNVTDWKTKSYLQELLGKPGSHLVVFAAHWCGFCSSFVRQAKSHDGNTELSLIDADDSDESLWDDYSIKIVPTIIVFENGEPVFRRDGKSMAGLSMGDLDQAVSMLRTEN